MQHVVLMETKALVVELLVLVLVLLVDVVEVLVTPEMAGNQGNHEVLSLKTKCWHLKMGWLEHSFPVGKASESKGYVICWFQGG